MASVATPSGLAVVRARGQHLAQHRGRRRRTERRVHDHLRHSTAIQDASLTSQAILRRGRRRVKCSVALELTRLPPFGSHRLSEEEQRQRYLELRDSPTAWRKLLDEPDLRQAVAYARRRRT